MSGNKKIIIAAVVIVIMLAAVFGGIILLKKDDPNVQATPSATTSQTPVPTLSPAPLDQQGKVEKIKVEMVDSLLNTYTKSQTVKIAFTANVPTNEDLKITYTVINTLNQDKITDTVTIHQGYEYAAVEVKDLQCGHYNVYVKSSSGNAEPITQYIAVVPDVREQNHTSTPFAIDHASSWHLNANLYDEYAQLLKLMGVDTVRERIKLSDVYRNGKYSFTKYDKAFDALVEQGFKLSVTFHDSPEAFRSDRSKYMAQDLFALYDLTKEMVDHFGDKVDVWEIWNEQDVIYFANDTPDEYAAFLKAMALAMDDSATKPVKALGSFARTPDFSIYGDWMMENGVMDYVDIYNYHTYVFPGSGTVPQLDLAANIKHVNYAEKYAKGKAIWQTETGVIINNGETPLNQAQQYQAARYVAVSSLQSYVLGVDKTFQFLMLSYGEGDASFGFYSKENTPMPMFTAYTTLIHMLGNAQIKGIVNSQYTNGYLVDNAGCEVLMLWNDQAYEKEISLPAQKPITVTDMNGAKKTYNPQNGAVKLRVGQYPIYVTAQEDFDNSIYTPHTQDVKAPEVHELTKAQRIVIKPVFGRENAPFFPKVENAATDGEALKTGYKVKMGSATTFSVEVYNFGNEAVEGVVNLSVDGGWKLDKTAQSITLGPKEKKVLSFTLSGGQDENSLSTLRIDGAFTNGEASPAVARITAVK